MPTSAGPNIVGENNIVLAYDTGDTVNSYKGEPTVNVLPSNKVLLTSYNDHGGSHTTDTNFTLFGNASLRTTSNPAHDWNGVYLTGLSSILTPGVTYTYSFYIYFTSDNTTISYFGYGAPGYTGVKGQWNRVSTTFTATTQDYFYVTLQYSLGQPVTTYYLANLQIEANSHATQFINGTRSVTQGLLPIISNTSLDLTNVSFNSNAQITFDGTNDYINTSSPSTYRMGTGDFTLECVMKQSKTTGHCLLEARGDNLKGYLWVMNISDTAGRMCLFLNDDIGGQHLFYQDGGYTATSTTQYYHLSVTVNRSTRKLIFYINGAQAGNEVTISHSNSISPSSGDFYHIGYDRGGAPWYGDIPVFKHYNKTLSAVEIQQNYKQYKSRFNIS